MKDMRASVALKVDPLHDSKSQEAFIFPPFYNV